MGSLSATADIFDSMSKHLIALNPRGFVCSCGEEYDASERSLLRKKDRPLSVAAQHQLAALVKEAVDGGHAIVTNCLACSGESIIPAVRDDTVSAYAEWLRTPCNFCGKTPLEVSGGGKPKAD